MAPNKIDIFLFVTTPLKWGSDAKTGSANCQHPCYNRHFVQIRVAIFHFVQSMARLFLADTSAMVFFVKHPRYTGCFVHCAARGHPLNWHFAQNLATGNIPTAASSYRLRSPMERFTCAFLEHDGGGRSVCFGGAFGAAESDPMRIFITVIPKPELEETDPASERRLRSLKEGFATKLGRHDLPLDAAQARAIAGPILGS